MTLEKEREAYNGGGIELPNLCDKIEFEAFKNWDGSSFSVQHLKMHFISKKKLNSLTEENEMHCDL